MILFESVSHDIGSTRIFSDLTLCVNKNEKVLILGKSGLGKTSLFRLILGFEQPKSGQIRVNGLQLNQIHIHQIRRQIFYLSQDIDLKNDIILRLLTEVWEFNFSQPLPREMVDKQLNFLELSPAILQKRTKDLSGGERQRTGLLIGFLLDRPIWLLDEPTSALDDTMKKKIADHILSSDKTCIIISHDRRWQDNPTVRIERWS
ncbi:MAG: ATP-binding cassette domain-containing protein [Proteobacteria bacterium]|nr:ATP-binding cassette domain-containing protein [Desulfobacula sp.]MBU4133541.1 ATP-binding cassette domain-containing protein [Pseudomonadota bacterium]